jgi:hypothetical protein
MVLMSLVTDVPGPLTTGVLEYLEDAEETHAARRRESAPARSASRPAPRPVTAAVVSRPAPVFQAQPAKRPVAPDAARKIPPASGEPDGASDDH